MVSVGQHLWCLYFEKKCYQELTVMVLQRAALIPNARRYPAAWSSACTGSGRGWGFPEVFVSSRFKNCWYASPSAKFRPVAVWTRESNSKKINQRGHFLNRRYIPLGDPSKDLPIPMQLDWRKQYQVARSRALGIQNLSSPTLLDGMLARKRQCLWPVSKALRSLRARSNRVV